MQLISVYNVMPPIETLLAVIAGGLFILALFFIIGCTDIGHRKVMENVIIGGVAILIGSIILTWNTYHLNQNRYEYLVTDVVQIQQMVDDGWVVVYSEDNVYTLKKGE